MAEVICHMSQLIQQLESNEKKFKSECKRNLSIGNYNSYIEWSNKQFIEYKKFLNLFSTKKQQRDDKIFFTEHETNLLKSKIDEIQTKLFSNLSITYKPLRIKVEDMFGKLTIKVSFD